ncbi:endothelin-converting enzyme 1-like [Haemaphysalis longicornis]
MTLIESQSCTDVNASGAGTLSGQQPPEKPAIQWLQLVLASVFGVCLAAVLLLYLINPARSRGGERDRGLCQSQGCLGHAELIDRHVNRNVDPCHDFKAFACSRWTDGADPNGYGTALMSRHMTAWFKDFKEMLENGTKLIPFGVRPLRMFELCMSDVDEASTMIGIRELQDFMRELRIPWPAPPFAGVEPLGVLLDLAYNWNLGFWFEASPLTATNVQNPRTWSLLIEPGSFVGSRAAQHQTVVHAGAYTSYWNSLRHAFAVDSSTTHAEHSKVEEIAAREADILMALFKVTRSSTRHPARFAIRDIERYTPNISAAVWNREIEQRVASEEVTSTLQELPNSITVSDVALMAVINSLYAKYTREQILEHIGWFFVQVFAPIADRKFLVSRYGSQAMADTKRHAYCATEVEATYRFLVTALYTKSRFSSEARAAIDFQLESVKEAALGIIASGRPTWADNSSRELLAAKVSSLRTLLWPPADLLHESKLLAMYGNVSANESCFAEHWFNVFYAKRALLHDPRPLYDAYGTASMAYGGLGFSYAAQLVRAFKDGGWAVDTDGNIAADSWAPPSWKQGSQTKLQCLKPDFDSPFPEIPAIEIAHAAFRHALGNDSALSRRVTLDYTEEQVFFITACFTLCSIPSLAGRFFGGDCNKAARNYAPIAEAFHCRDGASMKPKTPCSYFD